MNSKLLGLLAAGLLMGPMAANAQLTSVDHGAAAIDANGLMWANTVGSNLTWSPTGAAGSAQAWIAGLNASDYGGYNNWTLATGNGSAGVNTTTDQLGELFYKDCGNTAGTSTVLNNPGKNCGALSAVNTALNTNYSGVLPGAVFFSSSLYGTTCCNIYDTYWWVFSSPFSSQGAWNYDTNFGETLNGEAIAVRTPEIDPASAASAFTLLLGGMAVLRGFRTKWRPHGDSNPGSHRERVVS